MKGPLKVIQDDQWYADGLSFACTGCGQCCSGAPGYVWLTEDEIQAIADYLKQPLDEFVRKFIRRVGERFSLREYPKNGQMDCVFLKDNKCEVYPVRPKQCRTFPWWPQMLKSRADWDAAAKWCEGICKDANVVPVETITQQLNIHLHD